MDSNFDAMMKRNQASYDNNNAMASSSSANPNFDFFASDTALSTPNFMTFPDQSPAGTGQGGWISEGEASNTQLRRASRRVSGGLNNSLIDKVAKYEPMANGQRPATPPTHNAAGKHAGSHVLSGKY
jgi:regulatory protein SWI5